MASRLYRHTFRLNLTKAISFICLLLISVSVSAHLEIPLPKFPETNPDLTWKTNPFHPFVDASAKYIDYQQGSDSNDGSRQSPWKHHPWDKRATAKAKTSKGVVTYYFKKGVTYYGSLTAAQSGTNKHPIRLTVKDDWGTGKAIIAGTSIIQDTWHHCNINESRLLPEAYQTSTETTWCTQTPLKQKPSGLIIKNNDGSIKHLTHARSPNWNRLTQDDPRNGWYKLEDIFIQQDMTLPSTKGFHIGEYVYPVSKPKNKALITQLTKNSLTINIREKDYPQFKNIKQLSNGQHTSKVKKQKKHIPVKHVLIDTKNFKAASNRSKLQNLKDADLWIEPRRLPIPITAKIEHHNIQKSTITTRFSHGVKTSPISGSRYYLEGLPQFLDVAEEFAFSSNNEKKTHIYLRLNNQFNPNNLTIEATVHNVLLNIKNKKHITVSGLNFRSNNQVQVGTNEALYSAMYASAIQIRGSSSHINIHHNQFNYLTSGIIGYPAKKPTSNIIDFITINDNTFEHIDGSAIALGNGQRRKKYAKTSSRLINIEILRNRLHDIGLLSLGQRGVIGVGGEGILVNGGEVVEIAYNHSNYTGGPGVHLVLGAEYARGKVEHPFLRGLIHHNKVTNSLLTSYDFGAISSWTGGPVYIYNNIAGNPVGYRAVLGNVDKSSNSIQRSSYGIGIYLDGVYKAYVFNNIVWGISNDLDKPIFNAVGFNEARGFMHSVFQNTFYNFAVGLHRGGGTQHNRNYYMSNLLLDMSHKFIQHKTKSKDIEFDSIAYTNNIFLGHPKTFGQISKGVRKLMDLSFEDWKNYLDTQKILVSDTGILTTAQVVSDKTKHDFRLSPNSPAINKGVKVFVPWSLSNVVGEWHFYKNKLYPGKIIGENINMNSEWIQRPMFHQIPRNNLTCKNIQADDFVDGLLETWVTGSLEFNGKNQSCYLKQESLTHGYEWTEKTHKKNFSGKVLAEERDSVDIKTKNFIIESVFKTAATNQESYIVSKINNTGYQVSIDKNGKVSLTINFKDSFVSRNSQQAINDNQWHHLLIEANRDAPEGINIYIDGMLSNGTLNGAMKKDGSISNTADFYVGSDKDSGYFKGDIDFLRIAKSTLKESNTNIDELYNWQFYGPQLSDFNAKSSATGRQNAGAVETIR